MIRSLCPPILAGAMGLAAAGPATAQPADLILHNATIWTVDARDTTAQAVASRGEKIIAVGKNNAVLDHRGPKTRVIDLKGAFVVPGFNDTHVHFGSAARFLEFNVMAVGTQAEFVRRVREAVSTLEGGEWILGGYWGAYDDWALGTAGVKGRKPFRPDMRRIAALTKNHPMFIQKFDGSVYAVNAAALKAVGLDPDKPDAPGVDFVRDDAGRFLGFLRGESARRLFRGKVPRSFSRARRIAQTKRALAEIARHGVTSISDMSDDTQLDIYRELQRKGELTVRVDFRYPLDRWKELADSGINAGGGDAWIHLGSLKGHIDGIMGTSSARFFEPYSNDPANRGRWRRLMVDEDGAFVEGKFLKYMLDADKAGLQLTVHAIGDEANHLLLNYLEELNKQNGERDRRFRLVHAQVIAGRDFKRLGKLGVLAEVQPYHLSDDMRWMEQRIGGTRCQGAYAFRSIQQAGSMLVFGTDWPGTSASEYPINPLMPIYAAVTRQTTTGQPAEGWFPAQRIDIKEAIRAATYNGAYATFEEKTKGSIEVGKLADLTVLSRNLLETPPGEILKTKVRYTVVGGRIVFSGT